MPGDLLLVNGRIRTMDPANPVVSAVAIRMGRVVHAGDDAGAKAACRARFASRSIWRGAPRRRDSTTPTPTRCRSASRCSISISPRSATPPSPTCKRWCARRSTTKPPGTWILGRGYDDARLAERRHPTRADLDAVAPDHPVVLIRMCHHIGAANSAALRLAGVTRDTPDPDGGLFDRDEHGEPTGVLRERALTLVRAAMPEPDEAAMMAALEAGRARVPARRA